MFFGCLVNSGENYVYRKGHFYVFQKGSQYYMPISLRGRQKLTFPCFYVKTVKTAKRRHTQSKTRLRMAVLTHTKRAKTNRV